MNEQDETGRRCLMGIFAHPDDEAFGFGGTLRHYADQGVHCVLVCATRGEEGEIADPALATRATLGAVREQELRAAAREAGVRDVQFLDYHDGTLAQADMDDARGKVVEAIRRYRPQVVVTFDANGGYGHPDHIAIHRLSVAACQEAGDPNCFPAQVAAGLQPWRPAKLYAQAIPRSGIMALRRTLQQSGQDFIPGGNAATIPLEEMGTADDEITTAVTLNDAEYEAKNRVMQSHRTQVGPDSPFNRFGSEADRRAWLGTEQFVRLIPPATPGTRERDLFAGVD